jgi:SAM-dependent methyltransferase
VTRAESAADRWDARHMAADDVDPEPSRFLVEAAGDLPTSGRALDLACGRGRNAVWLARRGLVVDAVDVSTIGLAKTRTLAARHGVADRVRTIAHDLDAGVPPLEAAYDVVLCLHFRQPRLWPELPRLVAPGGALLVEVLARDATNLDVDPDYLGERDELLEAAGHLAVEFHGRTTLGKRAVDRLLARHRLERPARRP